MFRGIDAGLRPARRLPTILRAATRGWLAIRRLPAGASGRLALVTAVMAGGVTAAVLSPAPASAAPDVIQVNAFSASSSVGLKQLAIPCPSGYRAIGGIVSLTSSPFLASPVRVVAAVPSSTGYAILAAEQEAGTTTDWQINGAALCAPAAQVPGIEYQTASSSFDSTTTHATTAACTPGKKLIGMGGEAWYSNLDDRSQAVLTGIRPNSAGTEVTVTGYEDETGFGGNWNVYATAVCTDPLDGQQVVADVSSADSSQIKNVTPQCPAGTLAQSGGFDLTGAEPGQTHITSMNPRTVTAFEDDNGFGGNWRLRGYAVCVA